MMKRISAILLTLMLVLSMAACGGDETPTQPETKDNYVFTYKGTAIMMDVEATDIVAALGTPKSYTEETSCAFEGLDKTYYYGSFYLSTYPMDDKDFVYSVWFADDSVATAEGIRIGSTQSQVESAYGTANYNGSNAFIMTKGESKLTIILTDGEVSSVQYEIILN
jgi:hypothetical protein